MRERVRLWAYVCKSHACLYISVPLHHNSFCASIKTFPDCLMSCTKAILIALESTLKHFAS